MTEMPSKEKAPECTPEAKNQRTNADNIVQPEVCDSIEAAVSAGGDPCGFAVVIERIREMSQEDFKAQCRGMAEEYANGSSVDAELMLGIVNGIRAKLRGKERVKARWETDPKPWPEDVDLLSVIREIENIIRRVMVCEERYVTAAAYFIVATWFVEYLQYAPYAVITAPAKRCGKSTLLDLMGELTRRPYQTGARPSEAYLYRLIEESHSTILLDEVDTYLNNAFELQGILDSGVSRRQANIGKCRKNSAGDYDRTNFNTFGFKVMSGIAADGCGAALVDRAIVLRLSRKTRAEKREKLRHIPIEQWDALRSKLRRLELMHAKAVEEASAHPLKDMPGVLGDRDCDKWEPLFIIADLCGKDEGRRLRNVACEITEEDSGDAWQSELLSDSADIAMRAVNSKDGFDLDFGPAGQIHVGITDGGMYGDCILSTTLYQALTLNPDGRWKEFGRSGRALSQHVMTRTITDHGVKAAKLKKANGRMGFKIYGDNGLMTANDRYGRRARKDE